MPTPLNNAVEFLRDFGFFNVVLPFLLVFTIVFGILEKTKLFGTEGKEHHPKKNLNAMVAFSMAFFVVAASNIVEVIQSSLPAVTLVLVIVLLFMLLLGSFAGQQKEGGFDLWDKGWIKWVLIIFVLIAVISIFLNSFGYLSITLDYVLNQFNDTLFASIVFIVLIVGAIFYILHEKKEDKKGD